MKVVHCPGCFFGFWHNWGFLRGLSTPYVYETISGSSLAAAFYLCGLNLEKELEFAEALRHKIYFLHSTLRYWLNIRLPSNCHNICKGRLIVLARKLPFFTVHAFDQWDSKEHFIDTLIASASPFYPYKVKNSYYIDCVKIVRKYPQIQSKSRYYVISKSQARKDFETGKRSGMTWKYV